MPAHTRQQLDRTCPHTALPTFACECDYFREAWNVPIPAGYADAKAREYGLYRDEHGAWQEAPRSDWTDPREA